MQRSESSLRLEAHAPFDQLSLAGRRVLAAGVRYSQHQESALILRQGARIAGAFVVLRGRLRVYALAPDGDAATLYWIGEGETCVLALNCVFSDLLYPAWVEAETATTVATITGPTYRALFDSEAAIRNATLQAFSTIVFRLMDELEQVHTCTLEERLRRFLLTHANADSTLHMTQQRIASHLGTSREVVARLFRALVDQGAVATRRGVVTININKLLERRLKS